MTWWYDQICSDLGAQSCTTKKFARVSWVPWWSLWAHQVYCNVVANIDEKGKDRHRFLWSLEAGIVKLISLTSHRISMINRLNNRCFKSKWSCTADSCAVVLWYMLPGWSSNETFFYRVVVVVRSKQRVLWNNYRLEFCVGCVDLEILVF